MKTTHGTSDINVYSAKMIQTAIYPGAGSQSLGALSYATLGLAGEGGEIANKVKKIYRDADGDISPEVRDAILDECGDVLWYLTRVIRELGGNPSQVMSDNMNKLYGRLERGTIKGSGDTR